MLGFFFQRGHQGGPGGLLPEVREAEGRAALLGPRAPRASPASALGSTLSALSLEPACAHVPSVCARAPRSAVPDGAGASLDPGLPPQRPLVLGTRAGGSAWPRTRCVPWWVSPGSLLASLGVFGGSSGFAVSRRRGGLGAAVKVEDLRS